MRTITNFFKRLWDSMTGPPVYYHKSIPDYEEWLWHSFGEALKEANKKGGDNSKSLREQLIERKKQVMETKEIKTYNVSRPTFKKLYDVACTVWKAKLEQYASQFGTPFSNCLQIPEEAVKAMYNACSDNQKKVFSGVFPTFNPNASKVANYCRERVRNFTHSNITDEFGKLFANDDIIICGSSGEHHKDRNGENLAGKALILGRETEIVTIPTACGRTIFYFREK